MTRRVRRRTCREREGRVVRKVTCREREGRVVRKGTCRERCVVSARPEGEDDAAAVEVDWRALPDDTVLQLFARLNYRDRASMASACRAWRALGSSSCLWSTLDLRAHRYDREVASSLASRCGSLRRLRLRGHEAAEAVPALRAHGLREVVADGCRGLTDATLAVLAARHEDLQSLQIGPDPLERISSDALRHVALCCSQLRRLRLSGLREADADAVGALARCCPLLEDVAFLDCGTVDETALAGIHSLRFLSVAGCRNLKWATASTSWTQLSSLIALDVSRTDVPPSAVSRLISHAKTLKLICTLNCISVEEEQLHNPAVFSNSKGKVVLTINSDIFRSFETMFPIVDAKEHGVFHQCNWSHKDKIAGDITTWLEWILSQSLLRIAESNPQGMDGFWLQKGTTLLLRLLKSLQEDVQERAATALATFVVMDDETANVDPARSEAVMQNGGIRMLLDLARCSRESAQSEAAKAIANLSVNTKVAKAVADEGGITILTDLAKSMNRLVAEEAAGGLWNLSVGEDHKASIAVSGGIKALAARGLANLAAHGDINDNNAAVGQEAGALEALVQLTGSQNEGVRQEAAGALWNLSFDDRNREAIAAVGGVEALDVHETAAGALWNLAFYSGNALRIVEEGGVPVLVKICSSSGSKMARFMSALALAYMFDGRMDEVALVGASSASSSKSVNIEGARRIAFKHIETFVLTFSDPQMFSTAAASSAPAALSHVAEAVFIQEAGHLRCSRSEIGRFVAMLRNPSPILRACAAFALLQVCFLYPFSTDNAVYLVALSRCIIV
ncbi:Protein ARABIDILLO 1 [Zea mays]|uniref:Protein ARABIDILLO 1 n=1 Tax=Zea mays TaxID=4577 RepID=A0A3L6DD63_MAIZE|nr:Protein ARABIDILLO 1 [Zea mays]